MSSAYHSGWATEAASRCGTAGRRCTRRASHESLARRRRVELRPHQHRTHPRRDVEVVGDEHVAEGVDDRRRGRLVGERLPQLLAEEPAATTLDGWPGLGPTGEHPLPAPSTTLMTSRPVRDRSEPEERLGGVVVPVGRRTRTGRSPSCRCDRSTPRSTPRRRPRCSCRRRAGTAPSARGRSSGWARSSGCRCCRGSGSSPPGSTSPWRATAGCRGRRRGTARSAAASARRRDLGQVGAEVPVPEERHLLLDRPGRVVAMRSNQQCTLACTAPAVVLVVVLEPGRDRQLPAGTLGRRRPPRRRAGRQLRRRGRGARRTRSGGAGVRCRVAATERDSLVQQYRWPSSADRSRLERPLELVGVLIASAGTANSRPGGGGRRSGWRWSATPASPAITCVPRAP